MVASRAAAALARVAGGANWHPAARAWPPPPNTAAAAATSTVGERSPAKIVPSAASSRENPTSTPSMLAT